jgi:hypothetical protein
MVVREQHQEGGVTCPDCDSARAGQHGGYWMGCVSCQARMIAHSPPFADSVAKHRILPQYADLLGELGLPLEVAHKLVRSWGTIIEAQKAKT